MPKKKVTPKAKAMPFKGKDKAKANRRDRRFYRALPL